MEEPRRLGGRYELGSVLGRGGMAEVYLAHDTRLGRTVAVKTLRADLARDPSFQARFRREAQSAASLNHPAIVAVYDTGEDMVYEGASGGGPGVSIPYIVMEYVDGSTLRELLHSGRKLLPERTLEMTVGILQALEYSHRAGIVHRDIKPANVMLTRTGQVKVMDFGIARAMGDSGMTMTQTAAVIGTAQYLSPEQAKGEQVDARSDLYSTGCLLYELLTVRPPFVGDSPVAVAYQHVREEPQPPSNFDPEITPEMDAIVLKALVKDPDYRYQSADEMRADIEACLDGQPVAATAAMGAAGYSGFGPGDQPTTALRQADPAGQTSMLPPMNPDDGGFGYDDRHGRRRQKKSNTSTILLVLAGILVLVGAVLIGKELFDTSGDGGKVVVPQLVGSTLEEAKAAARNADVQVTQSGTERCDQPKGSICSQDPAPPAKMDVGDTIQVVVSEGAPKVKVPDVVDKASEQATEILKDEKFKVEIKEIESSEDEPGTVLEQDPAGRSMAEAGTTVTLTVAKRAMQDLPDVVGQEIGKVTTQLQLLEFEVDRVDVDSEKPQGEVIAQSLPAGKHPKGSKVTLQVSKGPAQTQVPVPEFRTKTVAEAKQILAQAGFNTIQFAPGSSQDDNAIVTGSNPQPGTPADPATTTIVLTTIGGGGNGGNGNGGGDGGGGGFIGGNIGDD
ncbi:Stk1 family PASTA domain-containing Ser/Thr kinase [Streptomyces sp. NPDC006274]|uniref:Stk1 family PASTA domain-containing Ser/Thr kinase n=1 Tax=unclassified Streptomyces TaxID=2593676 RepID=UPI0033B8B628